MSFTKEYVSYEELYEAYLECRSRKASTANCIKFEMDLDKNLVQLWKDLNNFTYEIGKSICFVVNFRREVFAADFRDRIVHHLIIRRILNIIETKWFIQDNYSCRKGKGTLYGVKRLEEQLKQCTNNYTEDAYIFKGDFRNCFNKLSKTKIYNLLADFLKDNISSEDELKFDLYVIRLIIFNDCVKNCIRKQPMKYFKLLDADKSMFTLDLEFGMAVGNLTTQIFANFFLTLIDKFIKEVLHIEYYGRYVDDIYIIHKSKEFLLEALKLLKKFLLTIGCEMHPKKQYLQYWKHGVHFIGYDIHKDNIQPLYKVKVKFKSLVSKFIKKCRYYEDTYGLCMSLYEMDEYVRKFNSYVGIMTYFDSLWFIKEQLYENANARKYINNYYKFDIDENYSLSLNSRTKHLLNEYYELSLVA